MKKKIEQQEKVNEGQNKIIMGKKEENEGNIRKSMNGEEGE